MRLCPRCNKEITHSIYANFCHRCSNTNPKHTRKTIEKNDGTKDIPDYKTIVAKQNAVWGNIYSKNKYL